MDIDDDGNKTYTAEYNAISVVYNIKFIDGGDIIDPINVAYDDVIILPNARKEGYTFDGWYLDEAFSEKANTEFKMPAEDVILYGKWTKTPTPVPDPGGEVVPVPNTNASRSDNVQDDGVVDSTGSGELILENDKDENYGKAFISIKADELQKIIPLTDEDKNAILKGENIYIRLDVTNITNSVPGNDKVLVEEALDSDEKIGLYLDVSLFKKVLDREEKLEKLYGKIKISFELPQELINHDDNVNRVYRIIKIHNGSSEFINSEFENGILSFETDEFSTYAVVYSDTQESTVIEKNGNDLSKYILLFTASVTIVVVIVSIISFNRKNKS